MKRQRDSSSNQSPGKKSEGNMSTDLRSKIGAKLQTLLNGIAPQPRSQPRSRRQLYKDLFGENEYTPIIIDTPTIVIKSEPDVEECSNSTSSFNSQNFLLSAKNRLTELLNKPDDANKCSSKKNEKENALHRNKSASTSSLKANCSNSQSYQGQSLSNNLLSKKRKLSSSKDDSSESSTNQVHSKKLSTVDEAINPKDKAELGHSLHNRKSSRKNCSSFSVPPVNEDVAKDDVIIEESESFLPSDTVECVIEEDSSVITHLDTDYPISATSSNSSEKDPALNNSLRSEQSCGPSTASIILPIGRTLLRETAKQFSCEAEDSELVDDPGLPEQIIDVEEQSSFSDKNPSLNPVLEPEVVLLCIKKPTHEVITLEDNDDPDDIIEELYKCAQCNKAFRAKSLLNFHIRMHGSDSLSSPSSSQSCS